MTISLPSQTTQLKHEVNRELKVVSTKTVYKCGSMKIVETTAPPTTSKGTIVLPKEADNSQLLLFLLNVVKFFVVLAQNARIVFLQLTFYLIVRWHHVKHILLTAQRQHRSEDGRALISSYSESMASEWNASLVRLSAPTHVCVILNEPIADSETLYETLRTIARLFCQVGVKCLTVYQFNDDTPKQIKEKLIDEFQRVENNNNDPAYLNANKSENCEFLTKRQTNAASNNNSLFEAESDEVDKMKLKAKATNENQQKEQQQNLRFKFLSYDRGGRVIMVNACKSLATRIRQNVMSASEINQSLIDDLITNTLEMSEPQLIISIGSKDTLAGFSPWHLRLSEIIKIPSYRLINQITLRDILIKYNRIEKRFGK